MNLNSLSYALMMLCLCIVTANITVLNMLRKTDGTNDKLHAVYREINSLKDYIEVNLQMVEDLLRAHEEELNTRTRNGGLTHSSDEAEQDQGTESDEGEREDA